MTALILPRRFTQQPQGLVEIDWSNPLTQGLKLAINPSVGLVNLAGPGVGNSAPARVIQATGVQHQPSASVAYNLNQRVIDHTKPMSGFVVIRPQSGYSGFDVCGNRSGGGFGFALSQAANVLLPTFTYYGVAAYGATTSYDGYKGAFNLRTAFGFSITPNATGGYQPYVEGLPLGTAVNTGTPGASTANLGIYQRGDGGGLTSNVFVECLFLFEGALPQQIHKELSANPWQIFKPRKSVLYFGGGAAGITGTLAATESGSDTASLSGDVLVKGALAATESGADSAALAGKVLVEGALSVSESGADTAALAGDVLVKGALSASESGNDTASFIGEGFVPTATGALAASESGSDTASIAGKVYIAGTLSAVEGGLDGFAASGNIIVQGTLAASETGDDTAAFVQETLTLTPADLDAIAAAVWVDPAAVAAHAKLDAIIARITC